MIEGALPGWPLMLRRELAAAYIGLSPSTFDVERKAGRIPAPVAVAPGVKSWHRHDLEAMLEDRRAAPTDLPPDDTNPFD